MRIPRLSLSVLGALALALPGALVLAPPAQAAGTIVINEIESDDAVVADFVELINIAGSSADISGYVVKDSNNANSFTIPAGTTVAAGGYYVAEVTPSFGLGSADSARLFAPGDLVTPVDSFSWASHAAGTWSRCPDGTGPFVAATPTKGASNVCPGPASTWPGGSAVAAVDTPGALGGNVSGLAYEGTGTATPGVLWAVRNDPGTLLRLTRSGGVWTAGTTWDLNYPGGAGNPDAEGVALTDAGAAGGVFVATERDGSGGTRPAILRFTPGAGASLNATNDWNLSADLPGLGANQGLEAITWVPDSYLVARGFKVTGGAPYVPSSYANHGTGLFLVGVEQTGEVIAYALDLTGSSFTRVASFPSGFPAVMELTFERDTQRLWAVCDDSCSGRSTTFEVSTAAGPNQGAFQTTATYERPGGMPNLNNEGFTIASGSECSGGLKPAFWTDDSNTAGTVLRAGTLGCVAGTPPTITGAATSTQPRSASGWYRAPVTVSFTCTPGPLPLAGACPAAVVLSTSGANQTVTRSVTDAGGASASATVGGINIDLVAPTVAIKGVKKGKTYPKKKKPKCVGTDALSGIASCTVVQKKSGTKMKVTATATDKAGNVSVTTLTYKVKKPKKK